MTDVESEARSIKVRGQDEMVWACAEEGGGMYMQRSMEGQGEMEADDKMMMTQRRQHQRLLVFRCHRDNLSGCSSLTSVVNNQRDQ